MRRAERFLIDWLPVASRVVTGKFEREDVPLFPIEALRETLANARKAVATARIQTMEPADRQRFLSSRHN